MFKSVWVAAEGLETMSTGLDFDAVGVAETAGWLFGTHEQVSQFAR